MGNLDTQLTLASQTGIPDQRNKWIQLNINDAHLRQFLQIAKAMKIFDSISVPQINWYHRKLANTAPLQFWNPSGTMFSIDTVSRHIFASRVQNEKYLDNLELDMKN